MHHGVTAASSHSLNELLLPLFDSLISLPALPMWNLDGAGTKIVPGTLENRGKSELSQELCGGKDPQMTKTDFGAGVVGQFLSSCVSDHTSS